MPEIKILRNELDGKEVVYNTTTEFLVQVGKGAKGSYKTKYRFEGNLLQAVMWYNGINIGNGYKKRLIAPSLNKPILAKAKATSVTVRA